MGLKNVFWIAVIALIFYVGFNVVPIYYKGIIGIRGACKEHADLYKKYGREYVFRTLDETLNNMGIPQDNRQHSVEVIDNAVIVSITYNDRTELFGGRYTKDFSFNHQCEGELRSVF